MTKTAPSEIHLADYKPTPYAIDAIDLSFDLGEEATLVQSRLSVRRRDDADTGAPLVLDGQNMVLKSVKIDGRLLESHAYAVTPDTLIIENPPANFMLEIENTIEPQNNTALEGLYKSSGNFVTQCEAEGFRKITYALDRPDVLSVYSTEICADKSLYPVLLSNGNLVDSEDLPNNRHRVKWRDPHPKPSYLFALVAGDLASVEDSFTTKSGRDVTLQIFVEHSKEDRCDFAMESLKTSMRWDEDVFGLEYDLDIFMIVAVSDFNMGAMENKGLNVFNDKYVLARPDTATDADYANIEAIIAHEYFHNWTGNRVTCRDWFQLSLKEGLTVFRDQEFSADQRSRPVQRIGDVRTLRARQFAEDSGPFAHPVQPKSYIEINNFYTATVYEKGAEVVRMIHTLIGPEAFRKGMDLYFKRHDGEAATVEDFSAAMADSSGEDFSQFRNWYDQAGTPTLHATGEYDADSRTYALTVTQTQSSTPGQTDKKPVLAPLAMGLIGPDGADLPLRLDGEAAPTDPKDQPTQLVLRVCEKSQVFRFIDVPERPIPSLLRGFSAPVRLTMEMDESERAFLMSHDSDPFNRWEAGQQFATDILLDRVNALQTGADITPANAFIDALAASVGDAALDKAFLAQMLTLPGEQYIAARMNIVDVDAIHSAREGLRVEIAEQLTDSMTRLYHDNASNQTYAPDASSAGRRRLRNTALAYLAAAGTQTGLDLCRAQFQHADNMTDTMAALEILSHIDAPARMEALDAFYERWKDDNIVVDKWLALQAASSLPGTLDNVITLLDHESFSIRIPNKVRALVGAFCSGNQARFHAANGAGYAFLADRVLELDALNPQVAARLMGPLGPWRKFDSDRQTLMKGQIQRILDSERPLSPDVFEIATKSLA
ncbi:MAG: aminopeptidase N [Alphaproteobacteria bacterium]|nr:aminopeptidase N [Alphaproteobacteria bacterium]